jgi:hypothetical protein
MIMIFLRWIIYIWWYNEFISHWNQSSMNIFREAQDRTICFILNEVCIKKLERIDNLFYLINTNIIITNFPNRDNNDHGYKLIINKLLLPLIWESNPTNISSPKTLILSYWQAPHSDTVSCTEWTSTSATSQEYSKSCPTNSSWWSK